MAESQSKQCRKCGQEKPVEGFPKNRRECRVCMKARQRKWESDNRDRVNQRSQDWKAANPDRSRKIKERWYEANREAVLKKRKADYQANRRAVLLWCHEYYKRNSEAVRARVRKWVAANPLRAKTHWMNAKARRRNLPNTWKVSQARWALAYWGNACAACRTPIGLVAVLHWDHWIPTINPACPGTVAGNMVPLCSECNLTKNERPAIEWLEERFEKRAGKIARDVAAFLEAIQSQEVKVK